MIRFPHAQCFLTAGGLGVLRPAFRSTSLQGLHKPFSARARRVRPHSFRHASVGNSLKAGTGFGRCGSTFAESLPHWRQV